MTLTYPKRERLSVWLQGEGIEIGALNRPMTLPPTARVRHVDRMTREDLHRAYPELEGQELVEVDVIGDIEHMPAIPDISQDFVVANHLLEHLHDPIRGLQEMYRVLRDGGILFVAIPDPRVTFDQKRSLTTVDHLLQEHRQGALAGLRDHYVEWVAVREGLTDGIDARVEELMARHYSIHFHVWRPDNFLEFLTAAKREAALDLELVAFGACEYGIDDEFIVILRKGSATPPPPMPLPPMEESHGPIIEDPVAPPSLGAAWRARLAKSALAPVLRPVYHLLRRLLRR